ncbi:hypothetical protein OC844_007904, partial [Tilletia horrida]
MLHEEAHSSGLCLFAVLLYSLLATNERLLLLLDRHAQEDEMVLTPQELMGCAVGYTRHVPGGGVYGRTPDLQTIYVGTAEDFQSRDRTFQQACKDEESRRTLNVKLRAVLQDFPLSTWVSVTLLSLPGVPKLGRYLAETALNVASAGTGWYNLNMRFVDGVATELTAPKETFGHQSEHKKEADRKRCDERSEAEKEAVAKSKAASRARAKSMETAQEAQ